jgi:thiamine-monophosphate kinase
LGKTAIKDIGEFGLIQRIRRKYTRLSDFALCGIGDDAASLRSPRQDHTILVTTDILVEDVHFIRASTTPYLLGTKSLAINLSDIAAMGGIPRFFLLSIGIPPGISLSFVDHFYQGVTDLAEKHDVSLVGGDLTASPTLVINGVLIGHCSPDQVIYRKGAHPGDTVFVTGPLGDSALGLEIIRQRGVKPRDFGVRGQIRGRDGELLGLIRRHLAPPAPVRAGRIIAKLRSATAMIDISDGLLADLGHILEESHVGATIWVDQIPRSQAFQKWAPLYHPRPLDLALGGGEDYQLLFTAPRKDLNRVISAMNDPEFPLYSIGEVTPHARKLSLMTEHNRPYSPSCRGHDHFRDYTGGPYE